jgi:aminoglycoside phosphotransferase (APT) family kinase protein
VTVGPHPIPHGRTARRIEWSHLPPRVRAAVEERTGAPVAQAESRTSGFTPGLASVLTCEDGSRHFVKAASTKAQRMFAEAYREEARKLEALPPEAPAARLLWTLDVDDWFVIGLEHIESRQPHRPWRSGDLDAALDALELVADLLTPPPAALDLDGLAEEFADFPGYWDHLRASRPDLARLHEAAALAARFEEVMGGTTLVHTDVRDDNVLIRTDGTAVLCDWNFPCVGADWVDTLYMLIGPRGDGLDVEQVLASRRLTRDLPAESIDIALALVTGYFYRQAEEPVPPTSPHLRDHQRWQGDVCWHWLAERRGW